MYDLVGTHLMKIRTTDLSKRPFNLPDETTYAIYVDSLNDSLGRCTQDSVRKNLFVDMHRMGFINRYNDDGISVGPFERSKIKYVSLSEFGLEFVQKANNIFLQNMLYTRAIDTLTFGLADELLEITELNNLITEIEFQFFFSYLNKTLNGTFYTKGILIEYIKEFRSMSKYQRECVIEVVKDYCNPNAFYGNKKQKRDFHNWHNETQQIFMLMAQTVYFDKLKDGLVIKVGANGIFENEIKLKRSLAQKRQYFKEHSVSKQIGFELHHIIPLCWAKTQNEFSLLDVWENMIYIDGYSHSQISQNNNLNVILKFNDLDIDLIDLKDKIVQCKYKVNVDYAIDKQKVMITYNTQIRNSL